MVLSAIPCSFFPAQYEALLRARDGDEAMPPFLFDLGTRIAYFQQFLLIKENRLAMCSLCYRGTNPGAVTSRRCEAGFRLVGIMRLRREQETLSPVIGERVVVVVMCFSRPSHRRWVPGC